MKNYQRLFDFMHERHCIYLRRQAGQKKPWTNDRILQRYKFCNVYRELDATTVWMKQRVRDLQPEHRHLWFQICVARHFNWPATVEQLRLKQAWPNRQWSPPLAARVLQRWGAQAYTGAYMVNPPSTAELKALPEGYRSKVAWSCLVCLGHLWRDRDLITPQIEDAGSLQQAHFVLNGAARGWAGFTSYEVVSDLRWTRYLKRAPDIMTWAYLGPGALRGLQRTFGRNHRSRPPQDLALRDARAVLEMLEKEWPRGAKWPRLEMREVEHSLCEFDKYERARLGEGRPRSIYNGLADKEER